MKISEKFKTQYADYLKSYLPQEISRSDNFYPAVNEILNDLIELSTPEVCEARKAGLALGCRAADLAERALSLPDGREFIAGARFKNLDTSFPFIEIHVAVPVSAELLKEIQIIVGDEFKSLNPKGIKFKDKPNAHPHLHKWSHTVFGVLKQEDVSMPPEIESTFTQNLNWHPQYVSEYQVRLKEKPELDGFVRIGDIDEFQQSAADDALMVLNDTEEFCGVVAAIKSPLYGLPAVYMIESYLSKKWAGHKLAPKAHTYFFNELASDYKYVWGTIYDKNLSSLRTALRTGRKIIETEYFLKF